MRRRSARIYIAGPDVFAPHWDAFREELGAYARTRGITPLFPSSHPGDGPRAIYVGNTALIRQADGVLANLQCFRGSEPDSGTVFEVGFAVALGRPVWGFPAGGSYHEKVAARVGLHHSGGSCAVCQEGYAIEDFGKPLNLMLAIPVRLCNTWWEALDEIQAATTVAAYVQEGDSHGKRRPRPKDTFWGASEDP